MQNARVRRKATRDGIFDGPEMWVSGAGLMSRLRVRGEGDDWGLGFNLGFRV